MAASFVRDHGAASIKTAGAANINVVTGATAPDVGNVLVARILFDNFSTASQPVVSSIAKPAGEMNNWVFLGAARSTSTSAGSFASGELWAIQTSVAWPASTSYLVTLNNSVTMKATSLREFTNVLPVLRNTVGTAYSTTTTAASATTTGTTPVVGDLALGFLFGSNVASAQAGDTDTTGGSWSAADGVGSTGGNAATNNFGIGQYKVLTAASQQTYNSSAAGSAGNGAIVAILQGVAPPTAPVTAPTVVLPTAGSQERILITTPPTLEGGAASYSVYRNGTLVQSSVANATQINDFNASETSSQTYTVRGVNTAGTSTDSPASSSIVANPDPPSVTLTPGDTTVDISVFQRTYNAQYKIYRRKTPVAPWVGTIVLGNVAGATALSAAVDISGATTGEVVFVGGLLEDTLTAPVTLPSGWTLASEGSEGVTAGAGSHSFLAWRVKQAGDTTFTFSWGVAGKYQLIPFSYPGVDTTTPVDVAAYNASTTAASADSASITPSTPNSWIIGLFGKRGTTAAMAITPATGMTERGEADTSASRFLSLELADTNGQVTQAAHSYSATVTGSTASHGGTIVAALNFAWTLINTSSTLTAGTGNYVYTDTALTNSTSYDYSVTTNPQTPTVRESVKAIAQPAVPVSPPVTLVPTADISHSTNAAPASGTAFWSLLDDDPASSTNDAGTDYVSMVGFSAENFVVQIGDGGSGAPLAVTINLRTKGTVTPAITVAILNSSGTTLTSKLLTPGTISPTLNSWTLNSTELATIPTLNGLRLKMSGNPGGEEYDVLAVNMVASPGASGPATLSGAATLTNSSTISAGGTFQQEAGTALSQTSTLSAGGVRQQPAAITLTQASTVNATGLPLKPGAATLTQTSTLAGVGDRTAAPSVTLTQTSTIAGAAVPIRLGAATLTNSSTVNAAAFETNLVSVTLTQTSTMSAVGGTIQTAAVTLSQTSTMSAFGGGLTVGAATLTNSSILAGAGDRTAAPTTALTQTSVLSSVALSTGLGAAVLTQTSTLSSQLVRIAIGAITLTQTSTVNSAGIEINLAAITLTNNSTINALASGFGTQSGAAMLTNSSTISSAPVMTAITSVTLTNSSTVTVGAARTVLPAIVLTNDSVAVIGGLRTVPATGTLVQTNTLVVGGIRIATVAATLTNSSMVVVGASRTVLPTATLTQTSVLTGVPVVTRLGGITLVQPSVASLGALAQRVAAAVLIQSSTMSAEGLKIGSWPISVRGSDGDLHLIQDVHVRRPDGALVVPVRIWVRQRPSWDWVSLG